MSSVELVVEQHGRCIGSVRAGALDRRGEAFADDAADGSRLVDIVIRAPRGGDLHVAGRVVAGFGGGETRIRNVPLRDLFGDISIVLRCDPPPGSPGDDDGSSEALEVELVLQVRGDPTTVEAFEVMIADLERLQPRMLREIAGPLALRRANHVSIVEPADELRRLRDWIGRMVEALKRIDEQPFEALSSATVLRHYRAGDRILGDLVDVITAPGTVIRQRRPVAIGRVAIEELYRSFDVPEHRQLRAGCNQLIRRARMLERHCQSVLEAYEIDRDRWGSRPGGVDEQRHGRRRDDVQRWRREAVDAAERMRNTMARSVALATVPRGAGRLRPTPLWLARPGYRDAYRVLVEMERHGSGLLAGDDARMRLRGMDQLFEYWCFVQVVLAVAELAGGAVEGSMFELIDDVYRPDLRPGLVLRFAGSRGESWTVAYEPTFPRAGQRSADRSVPGPFRTVLGTGALRPDVVVRRDRPGHAPRLLVLDAKNSTTFGSDAMWKVSDYRSRIVDPVSGAQPARWVVFLHRNQDSPVLENVPGLLEGRCGGWSNWYLAALCVLPGEGEALRQLVRRFVDAD